MLAGRLQVGPSSRKGSSRVHTRTEGLRLRTYCTSTSIHTVLLLEEICFNFGEGHFLVDFRSRPSVLCLFVVCLAQQETRRRQGRGGYGKRNVAPFPPRSMCAWARRTRAWPHPPPGWATRTRTQTLPVAARWGRALAGGSPRTDACVLGWVGVSSI